MMKTTARISSETLMTATAIASAQVKISPGTPRMRTTAINTHPRGLTTPMNGWSRLVQIADALVPAGCRYSLATPAPSAHRDEG
ncbi:hypothetical protein GCM10009611_21360 [Arthrobacter roseus]